MNDKLHPALAEHAMERENERLRGLLAQLSKAPQAGEVMTRERLAAICEVGHDRSAFVAALSQQAEPRCENCDGTGDVHRADGEWLGECKECNQAEPAPAQDEQCGDARHNEWVGDNWPCPTCAAIADYKATRPAQTEQQPTRMPAYRVTPEQSAFRLKADWQNQSLIDTGFNTALDEVARLNAAPIAQTEQPEQSGLEEALKRAHGQFKYISEGGEFYRSTAAEGMRQAHFALRAALSGSRE
ncbi:hypothetical protein [Stutzerimonas stutzeri]|uniref:hypothetical protein n=1 Tax=Stutzerimonas stutzeri TaxID=316 RepID=UPI000C9B6C57|nr:hypothetical protein [Stutzerimonas stutzeri]PNG11913.1 hypothetical protein CXK97_19530 [Stutzerimonas stutzeri]